MNNLGFCISQKYIQKQFELLNGLAEIHFDTSLLGYCFLNVVLRADVGVVLRFSQVMVVGILVLNH